jgi:hypothetical protein
MEYDSLEVSVFLRNHDTFVANVEIRIFYGGKMLTIRDASLGKTKNFEYFIVYPSRTYEDQKSGKTKYFNYFIPNESLKSVILSKAITAYQLKKQTNDFYEKKKTETNNKIVDELENTQQTTETMEQKQTKKDEPWDDDFTL